MTGVPRPERERGSVTAEFAVLLPAVALLLGVVVALIKVARMVSLEADAGLWAFAALTVFLTVALSIDLRPFWREIGLTLKPGSHVDAPTGMDAAARPGEDRP